MTPSPKQLFRTILFELQNCGDGYISKKELLGYMKHEPEMYARLAHSVQQPWGHPDREWFCDVAEDFVRIGWPIDREQQYSSSVDSHHFGHHDLTNTAQSLEPTVEPTVHRPVTRSMTKAN